MAYDLAEALNKLATLTENGPPTSELERANLRAELRTLVANTSADATKGVRVI